MKQGDPLSPSLFIITQEYMLRGLRHLQETDPKTRYFIGLDFYIPSLAFADDILIFCNGSKRAVELVRGFLSHFERVSGQLVNNSKSCFVTSYKASPSRISIIKRALGFQQGKLPITYLGIPLSKGRKYTLLFDELVAKIRGRIQSWGGCTLSFGGHLVLIQSKLETIPCT